MQPHQDWNTITFAKPKAGPTPGKAAAATLKEAQRKGEVLAERKVTHQATASGKSAKALDDETEELKHAKVPTELRKALSQARAAKGLTQKQLAAQMKPPVAVSLITEYENGKAIPNNAVIAQLERALGAKLPRAPKK